MLLLVLSLLHPHQSTRRAVALVLLPKCLLLLLLSRNVFRCIRIRPPDVWAPCRRWSCRLGRGRLILLSPIIRARWSELTKSGHLAAKEDVRRRPW